MINAILACDECDGVSKDGTLPWPKNTKDLVWFKSNTSGCTIVMGSTTWKDPHMPRPLPNRTNIVVTSNPASVPGADVYLCGDITSEIKKIAKSNPKTPLWIIGGPDIINQTLHIIDKFYIGRIPGEYNCDTFLPMDKIAKQFTLQSSDSHPEVTFEIWERN